MVDINGAPDKFGAQICRKHLHVARKHNQLRAHGFNQLILLRLYDGLCGWRDREIVKRHLVFGGKRFKIAVIANDGADVNGQVARMPAV